MSEFKDNLERIEVAVFDVIPFVASLLDKARVIETDIPDTVAKIDSNGWIYVDPEKMKKNSIEEQIFLMAHEVMHAPPDHARRSAGKENPHKWNLATDCVVNEQLKEVMGVPDWALGAHTIADTPGIDATEEEIKKMSDVEVYELLLEDYDPREEEADDDEEQGEKAPADSLPPVVKKKPQDEPEGGGGKGRDEDETEPAGGEGGPDEGGDEPTSGPRDSKPQDDGEGGTAVGDDLTTEEMGGETIQEGGDHNDDPPEERKEGWKDELCKAAEMQEKAKGVVPAGIKRLVEDMTKPDLNIRSLLKQQVSRGLSTLVVNDWRRTSRKHPDLPGNRMLTTPTIHALVDTSGSIEKEELELFLGTMYEFSMRAEVRVLPWDGDSYETLDVKKRNDVMREVAGSLLGGGGTKIGPPLASVLPEMDHGDIVAVMTDGHVFDLEKERVQNLMRKVREKASSVFVLTTDKEMEADRWKVLKLEGR
jgi:predicted metal-dependent peptidase